QVTKINYEGIIPGVNVGAAKVSEPTTTKDLDYYARADYEFVEEIDAVEQQDLKEAADQIIEYDAAEAAKADEPSSDDAQPDDGGRGDDDGEEEEEDVVASL
ncbi:MAG TPA: hypothetical protein DHN29_17770, partial [Cytophagales bacterium]|nr:hypothetical protein [Cytophagales bacterium]